MGYSLEELQKLHPRVGTTLNFAKFINAKRMVCIFEFQGNVLEKDLTYPKFREVIRKLIRFGRRDLKELGEEIKEQLKQQILDQLYTGQVLLSFPHTNPQFISHSLRMLGVNVHCFVITEGETYEEKVEDLRRRKLEATNRYRYKMGLKRAIISHDLRRIRKQARQQEKKRRVKEALEVLINEKGLNFIYDD